MRTVHFHRAGQRGRDEPGSSPRVVWRLPVALLVQSRVVGHLEEGMATCSSILAWEIPWTEEPGGLQSMGLKELDTTY